MNRQMRRCAVQFCGAQRGQRRPHHAEWGAWPGRVGACAPAAGYLGHVTLIARRLQETADRCPFVAEQLKTCTSWGAYAAGPLQVPPPPPPLPGG